MPTKEKELEIKAVSITKDEMDNVITAIECAKILMRHNALKSSGKIKANYERLAKEYQKMQSDWTIKRAAVFGTSDLEIL